MRKSKFGYGWLLKWILAAILLASGLLLKIYDVQVVYMATGVAIVLFSLLRIYPLLKTLNKEVLRTMNLFEIVFDIIVGALMIYVVMSGKTENSFWITFYGFLLAFFFLARGIVFHVSLYYFGEKSEPLKFWFHIVSLLLASAIFVLSIMKVDIIHTLGWIVLFISLAGSGYLGYDGYGGYRKYRAESKNLNTEKTISQSPKVEKELPKPVPEVEKEEETYVN